MNTNNRKFKNYYTLIPQTQNSWWSMAPSIPTNTNYQDRMIPRFNKQSYGGYARRF